MTVVTNAQSVNIVQLDINPASIPATGFAGLNTLTGGEGLGGAFERVVVDQLPVSVAFLGAIGNWGRLCRIPCNAKIQEVILSSDVAIDSNATQTLAFDISVAFSDNANDGTPYYFGNFAAVGSGQPKNTKNGVTVGNTDANRNKLFGTITLAGNNAVIPLTEVTNNCSGGTTAVPYFTLRTTPLLDIFGYVTKQGFNIDNAGWMDLVIYVTAVSATPVAGNINGTIRYIV